MKKQLQKTILIAVFAIIGLSNIANAQYSNLINFDGTANGSDPKGSVVLVNNFLYGMTRTGGANNFGTIFKIKPDGTGYAKLLDFNDVNNGRYPQGALIYDGTFFYGMAYQGGTNDFGTIFKIMPDGTGYAKLLDFAGTTNGRGPRGSLFSDGTFLYGMTYQGGTNSLGTIFKIKPDGTGFVKLYDFGDASNGRTPRGSLVSDGTFLYGMTEGGGTGGNGTIFKIKPDGTGYAVILPFGNINTGRAPYGSLIFIGNFLYGMTNSGGTIDGGAIFKIMPDGSSFTKLFDLGGINNGSTPYGDLVSDGTFLYGMTYYGGSSAMGTIFKILPDGTGYVELLDFAGAANGHGPQGSLIFDGTSLYGMTDKGGANNMGVLFKYQLGTLGIQNLSENNTSVSVYPNPFSIHTTIQSAIVLKNAILTVYNLQGQAVKEIVNISGQTITLNRNNLPSGLYFIRLTENNKVIAANKLFITD